MNKSIIISLISSLAILGLLAFAIAMLNSTHSIFSLVAVVLSLIPMYFLYCSVVLGKYDKRENRNKRDYMIEKWPEDARKKDITKSSRDYGKMLDFPKDKDKKKNGK